MAFVNDSINPSTTSSTVFQNATENIYNVEKNILDDYISIVRHSENIESIKDVLIDCKSNIMHKLALLFEISKQHNILEQISDFNILDIGDYQFLYVNTLINMIDNDCIHIDILKKLYENMETVHDTQIIIGLFAKYYNSVNHDKIIEIYSHIDKEKFAKLLSMIIICDNNKSRIISDIKLYDLKQKNNYSILKKLVSSCSLEEIKEYFMDIGIDKNDIPHIIENSLGNPDKTVFYYLYDINDELNCTNLNTILFAINMKDEKILKILTNNFKIEETEVNKFTDFLLSKNDKDCIALAFKYIEIDVYSNNSLILRKAIISENVQLTEYLFDNYDFTSDEFDELKKKIKKITIILDDDEFAEYVINKIN